MKGILTIFDQKKWVFAYAVLFVLVYLIKSTLIDGSQFMMGLMALVPFVIGANSFDKSVFRK